MSNNISIQKTDVNLLEYIVDGEKYAMKHS